MVVKRRLHSGQFSAEQTGSTLRFGLNGNVRYDTYRNNTFDDGVQGELIFAGPFVMDTPENARRAQQDFLSGKMGRLDGVPI